jgi:hypothetical protein
MRAYLGVREAPVYRRDAFIAGLKACGYDVHIGPPQTFDEKTLFVCWNRYMENHNLCERMEAAGGSVLIAENGYLTQGGGSPHRMPIREWFALARSYHNDDKVVPDGDASRWNTLGVELQPRRADGKHILVCPNRNFGTPGRFMPYNWADDVAARLRAITKRPIRIRPHPGNHAPAKPLAEDLDGAWCTVIWTSSAGVHSLVAGVPVICEAPFWICKSAAGRVGEIDAPAMPDRLPAMQRLAWANWSLAEIQSGEAFTCLLNLDHLLRAAGEGEVRAAD